MTDSSLCLLQKWRILETWVVKLARIWLSSCDGSRDSTSVERSLEMSVRWQLSLRSFTVLYCHINVLTLLVAGFPSSWLHVSSVLDPSCNHEQLQACFPELYACQGACRSVAVCTQPAHNIDLLVYKHL